MANTSSQQDGALFRAVIGSLFTLPLLVDIAADWFGWSLFFVADAKIQSLCGSIVQFVAGWAIFKGALQATRRGRVTFDTWVSASTALLYGRSLYVTFCAPAGQPIGRGWAGLHYAAPALVITLVAWGKLFAAKRQTSAGAG